MLDFQLWGLGAVNNKTSWSEELQSCALLLASTMDADTLKRTCNYCNLVSKTVKAKQKHTGRCKKKEYVKLLILFLLDNLYCVSCIDKLFANHLRHWFFLMLYAMLNGNFLQPTSHWVIDVNIARWFYLFCCGYFYLS